MSRCIRMIGLSVSIILAACGGGGGGGGGGGSGLTDGSSNNVVPIVVNSGLSGNASINQVFVSVQVCVPATAQCATVDHVLLDTGSMGLRVIPSALGTLAASLPVQTADNGNALASCVQFVDTSHAWGPVRVADLRFGEKLASDVSIQLITSNDATVGAEPVACGGGDPSDNLTDANDLGINGILGIGHFQQDCGSVCTILPLGYYYGCTGGICTETTLSLARQLHNPITKFSSDNNGSIIALPSVGNSGVNTLAGTLTFGIGTRSNNQLGNAQKQFIDNVGRLTTTYNGVAYSDSFIDSGSNTLYFPDNVLTPCSTFTGFYCPSSTVSRSATIEGEGSSTARTVNFNIGNAENLFWADPSFSVFKTIGGVMNNAFDWGLPFFYGRDVYTAIQGQPGISAPYVAF